MKGHEQIFVMRRQGVVPVGIWITDGETICAQDWLDEPCPFTGDYYPSVQLEANDIPEAMDFRFVINLAVHVVSDRSDFRGRRLHAALVSAKAGIVATALKNEVLFHG